MTIKINQFPSLYQFYDLFELIVGIVSLLSGIATIYFIIDYKGQRPVLFSFISIFFLFIFMLNKSFKLQKITFERLLVFTRTFHKFTDTLRDSYYSLPNEYKQKKLAREDLLSHARDTIQTALDLIAEAFKTSTGYDVCVTLKYFIVDEQGIDRSHSKRPEDYIIKTLCRSKNCDSQRSSNSTSRIGDNTDFLIIMRNSDSHFYSSNLKATSKMMEEYGSGPYKNSNPSWSDFYLSTIVVPIRIKRSLSPIDPYPDDSHLHIGFLCVDSKSTSAFPRQYKTAYCDYLKGFADALFIYLDRVIFYLHEISKSSEEVDR